VTSSTLRADPPSNETIDVFYINKKYMYKKIKSSLKLGMPATFQGFSLNVCPPKFSSLKRTDL